MTAVLEGESLPSVLIVSERAVVRSGIRSAIGSASDFQPCRTEADGFDAAMGMLGRFRPRLAILDLSLRNGLGLSFVRDVKQQYSQVKLIVTSLHDDPFYAGQVLAAGADGYLDCGARNDDFVDACRTVARGNIYLSPNLAQQMLCRQPGKRLNGSTDLIVTLTERELQVFELLGDGATTKRIARQMNLSSHTVETYRERIRHKIGAQDGAALTYRAIVWRLLNS